MMLFGCDVCSLARSENMVIKHMITRTFGISLALVTASLFSASAVAASADTTPDSDDPNASKVTVEMLPVAENQDDIFVAGGVVKEGEALANSKGCAGCHGPAGNSLSAQYPKLAGQHSSYLLEELEHFKSKERDNSVMASQVAQLSEADMRHLAAYYAAQTPTAGAEGSDDLLALGLKLYRGGDTQREIPACIACHGALGRGNAGVPYPMLAGQHAEYTIKRLKDFRTEGLSIGETELDESQDAMIAIALRLSDTEINALAYTLQGMIKSVDQSQIERGSAE